MRTYNLYIIAYLFGLFLLNSCLDEELVQKSDVTEGIPVALSLKVGTSDKEEISTRADLDPADEKKVLDVYVYVFKQSGGAWVKEAGALSTVDPGNDSGSVTFAEGQVTSGKRRIYAVANFIQNGHTADELNAITTLDELKRLTFSMQKGSIQPLSAGLLMSGTLGGTEDGACVVPEPTATTNRVTVDGTIVLQQLNSKITFTVEASRNDSVFVPKSWQIVHVPKKSALILSDTDCLTADAADYFNSEVANFETYIKGTRTVNGNPYEIYKGGSFSFYMMENRKVAKQTPPNQHQRELEEKAGGGLNASQNDLAKTFVYAPDYATYVILKGSFYAYKNNSMEVQTSAEVTYSLHLGKGTTPFDDFKSERGKNYTYHVKIGGVEDIVYEVTTGKEENQPGAEGAVVRSAQNILLDAHYETQCVTFYQDQLENLAVRIKTAYDSGSEYRIANGEGAVTSGDFIDYGWVKFVKNTNASTTFAKYPATKEQTKQLLDIKAVLKELSAHASDGSFWKSETINGKAEKVARYTVFIDENYYDVKPGGGTASWAEFANKPAREMHILCKTDYSADKESSLTSSSILISQRSIKTFYNTTVAKAWGVETVNEDAGILMKADCTEENNVGATDVRSNGRFMTFRQIKFSNNVLNWDTYVDYETNENKKITKFDKEDKDTALSAIHACFSRNRDLDGNGKIGADEIRWYVPATNQLVGMWIGRDALEPETHLFQADPTKIKSENAYDYHLFSSNGTRFWAEEGTSLASNSFGTRKVNVRCVRNLGETYTTADKSVPTAGDMPTPYATIVKNNNSIKLTFGNMNNDALRSGATQSALASHKEHTGADLNKPYRGGFLVDTQNRSRCANGWRIPNQRELILILGNLTTGELTKGGYGHIGSATQSNLSFKGGLYYAINAKDQKVVPYMTISESVTPNTYRCIKDL